MVDFGWTILPVRSQATRVDGTAFATRNLPDRNLPDRGLRRSVLRKGA